MLCAYRRLIILLEVDEIYIAANIAITILGYTMHNVDIWHIKYADDISALVSPTFRLDEYIATFFSLIDDDDMIDILRDPSAPRAMPPRIWRWRQLAAVRLILHFAYII